MMVIRLQNRQRRDKDCSDILLTLVNIQKEKLFNISMNNILTLDGMEKEATQKVRNDLNYLLDYCTELKTINAKLERP